jgi:hypothetical protein
MHLVVIGDDLDIDLVKRNTDKFSAHGGGHPSLLLSKNDNL